MARVKVFDTNAMVAVTMGSLVVPSDVRVIISVITRLELLSWPNASPESREVVRRMVDTVETAPITDEIEAQAVQIRVERLLKLPDAVIAATALVRAAPLVTNDAAFRRLSTLTVESF